MTTSRNAEYVARTLEELRTLDHASRVLRVFYGSASVGRDRWEASRQPESLGRLTERHTVCLKCKMLEARNDPAIGLVEVHEKGSSLFEGWDER